MDKDCVPCPQGHCLAMLVIIWLMAWHFLLLKEVSFLVGPLNMVPQLLNVFAGSGCGYWLWGNSQGDIDGESRLPTIHQEVGAEVHTGVVGAIVCMYQNSNTAFQVRPALQSQCPHHVD